MKIKNIQWDDDTIRHIAEHSVEPREVEQVCFYGRPLILKTRQNRYYALGQTKTGRYLTIIFEYIGKEQAEIVTARAMSSTERRLYVSKRR